MKSILFLLCVAGVFAQDVTIPSDLTTPAVTAGNALTTDPVLSSELSLAACVTGNAYKSCEQGLTVGGYCTQGNEQALLSCACSSASRAISCLNICSISYDVTLLNYISTTCKNLAGVALPTNGNGASKAGAAHLAMPTGLVDGVAAAAAVAGVIGAML